MNQESPDAVAQTYVATRDHAPERPRDPRDSAIINPAKVADNLESDIAPAVGPPFRRALTRRSMFMNMLVSALTGTALSTSASDAILAAEADAVEDPAYSAIKVHREAFKTFEAAISDYSAVEFAEDEDAIKAADECVAATSGAESHALDALVETAPATLAGASAVLNYVVANYNGDLFAGRRHELIRDNGMLVDLLMTIDQTIESFLDSSAVAHRDEVMADVLLSAQRRMGTRVASAKVSDDDPVFAAIAEYKRAEQEYCDICEPRDEAEYRALENSGRPRETWYDWSLQDPEGYEACRKQGVPADLAARWRTADEAYTTSIHGLAETAPTTLSGAAAMLAFWIEDDPFENGHGFWHMPMLQNLAEALKLMATA